VDRGGFLKAGAVGGGLAVSLRVREKLQATGKTDETYTDTYHECRMPQIRSITLG
jgi:hypothetical protein